MKNILINIAVFVLGTAAGTGVTYFVTKKHYDKKLAEHDEDMANYYESKLKKSEPLPEEKHMSDGPCPKGLEESTGVTAEQVKEALDEMPAKAKEQVYSAIRRTIEKSDETGSSEDSEDDSSTEG